jgi:hypothetical protein
MHSDVPMRIASRSTFPIGVRFAALLAAFALAGCGAPGGSSSEAAKDGNLTDASCGTSVTAKLNGRMVASLASTYWQYQPPEPPSLARQLGSTQYGTGKNCPSFGGSGCGTATASFEFTGVGQVVIVAARATCGEALACGHGEGEDRCTITVDVNP